MIQGTDRHPPVFYLGKHKFHDAIVCLLTGSSVRPSGTSNTIFPAAEEIIIAEWRSANEPSAD
jgi:hypothetical protein